MRQVRLDHKKNGVLRLYVVQWHILHTITAPNAHPRTHPAHGRCGMGAGCIDLCANDSFV